MSIIHEALKKAQSDLQKQENSVCEGKEITKLYEELHHPLTTQNKDKVREKSIPPSTKPVTVSEKTATPRDDIKEMTQYLQTSKPRSNRKSWFKLIFTLVCLFFIGTSILFGIFLYLLNEASPAPNIIQPKFSKTKNAPMPTQENPLILSGTMMMGDKRVALINNGIYEVGEFVKGKKITAITLEKVELLDGENTIILKAE